MTRLKELRSRLKQLANKEYAAIAQRFFKTGPGEYGEGDIFCGIRVPVLRKLSQEFEDISIEDAEQLLHSPIHEERLLSLLILIRYYRRGTLAMQKRIYSLYLSNTAYINNWDLVDVTAEHIVGAWLFERDPAPLFKLVRSKDLWERRIALLSTFHFIKRGEFDLILTFAGMLLRDSEDLIHKASGWMLRETGNRDLAVEEKFLRQHYKEMPRTMLRYAIEKFPEQKRQQYLKGLI